MSQSERSYFSEYRKGEINELRLMLQDTFAKRNEAKQRAAVKKVVACMTLGMDMSSLFSELIMASNTTDIIQKKLVYLYLAKYAPEKSELTLLTVNTLQKDCRNESPFIRSFALRALTSLRVPSLISYIMDPLKSGLVDTSSHVRKTAALCCARVYQLAPNHIKDDLAIVNRLYEMIRDNDPQVAANSIQALNEILADGDGIKVTKAMVLHLLRMFDNFSEWNQIAVIESVFLNYQADDEVLYPTLNILDKKLHHPNSAVVMSVIKLFLRYTEREPEVHRNVYHRIRDPLLTLLSAASPELELALLAHIKVLIDREPAAFQDQYKRFFARYSDPVYTKLMKIEILQLISAESQHAEIISELAESAKDMDVEVARKAILAIGRIAIRVDAAVETCTRQLLELLDLESPTITEFALVALRDLLRRYRDISPIVIPELQKCIKVVSASEGKSALVWILGEYGDEIEESPYILEDLISGWSYENSQVRLQLLTTTVKLFFRRTSEMKENLMTALGNGCADASDPDVHDRALFYVRLLSNGIDYARKIVSEPHSAIVLFEEDARPDVKDRIYDEFNTLSVVYEETSDRFLKRVSAIVEAAAMSSEPPKPLAPNPVAAPAKQQASLLQTNVPAAAAAAGSRPSVSLKNDPQLSATAYEATWKNLPPGELIQAQITNCPRDAVLLEAKFKQHNMNAVAKGIVNNQVRLYLYGQENPSDEFVFVELLINLNTNSLNARVKSTDDSLAKRFVPTLKDILFKVIQ